MSCTELMNAISNLSKKVSSIIELLESRSSENDDSKFQSVINSFKSISESVNKILEISTDKEKFEKIINNIVSSVTSQENIEKIVNVLNTAVSGLLNEENRNGVENFLKTLSGTAGTEIAKAIEDQVGPIFDAIKAQWKKNEVPLKQNLDDLINGLGVTFTQLLEDVFQQLRNFGAEVVEASTDANTLESFSTGLSTIITETLNKIQWHGIKKQVGEIVKSGLNDGVVKTFSNLLWKGAISLILTVCSITPLIPLIGGFFTFSASAVMLIVGIAILLFCFYCFVVNKGWTYINNFLSRRTSVDFDEISSSVSTETNESESKECLNNFNSFKKIKSKMSGEPLAL